MSAPPGAQKIAGSDFDYVVIGAGPAGLAAAGHLAKTGARVAVFEGRPRPENVFGSYPVVLNPRGLASLRALDPALIERSADVGLGVKELHIVPDGRTVAQVKTFGTGIMRDQAAQLLLDWCEARSEITFFWEHKLKALDITSHSCSFERLQDGQEVSVTGLKRLIAADGNRSRVRSACAQQVPGFVVEADPWGFQLRFMTSRGRPEQSQVSPDFHYVLGDKGYVCQQPDGVWNVSLRVLPEVDGDFLTADECTPERLAMLRSYVERHADFAAEHLLDEEAYKGFYTVPAFDGLVVKCSCLNPAGWICLVGDAAHAVQPATGEGINSGLEDAAVLAMALRDCPDDAFGEFDRRHRANAHALNALAQQAREKVLASPRQRATNVMVTIGLGIAKKLRIIEGTAQDFMLGELAHTIGTKPYAELVEMDTRQTRWLRSVAKGITRVFRVSDASPLDKVNAEPKNSPKGEVSASQQEIGG